MDKTHNLHPMGISAPNLINICIDENRAGEFGGRIYERYHNEPVTFTNLMQLLRWMDSFFDELSYPQASTKSRTFQSPHAKQPGQKEKPRPHIPTEQLLENRGKQATIAAWVKYRQNATWQGEILWLEKNTTIPFSSTLDFIKLIDNILIKPT